jgi:hypothetical protein
MSSDSALKTLAEASSKVRNSGETIRRSTRTTRPKENHFSDSSDDEKPPAGKKSTKSTTTSKNAKKGHSGKSTVSRKQYDTLLARYNSLNDAYTENEELIDKQSSELEQCRLTIE